MADPDPAVTRSLEAAMEAIGGRAAGVLPEGARFVLVAAMPGPGPEQVVFAHVGNTPHIGTLLTQFLLMRGGVVTVFSPVRDA